MTDHSPSAWLVPVVSSCWNFTAAPNGPQARVTLVVVPQRVTSKGHETLIAWACSYGRACHNARCVYAYGKRAQVSPQQALGVRPDEEDEMAQPAY